MTASIRSVSGRTDEYQLTPNAIHAGQTTAFFSPRQEGCGEWPERGVNCWLAGAGSASALSGVPSRRLQILFFFASFLTFAWFHQGGGWNQNARFAEVRAIVEKGTFAVDDYLVYLRDPKDPGNPVLIRPGMERGEFTFDGKRHQLTWGDWRNVGTAEKPEWAQLTVNDAPLDPSAVLVKVGEGTCTGDVGYAPDGHFHPNKPPGASLLAVPVYFLAHWIERLAGVNPDHWWVITVNSWLVSVFTVGLVSALGVVAFIRLAGTMFPGMQAAVLAAAAVFACGTTFFPFATLFFDHNLTAVLLLTAFATARADRPLASGVWSGVAAVTNYLAAIPGAMFGLYLLLKKGRPNWRSAILFTAGVLPSLVGLLTYNTVALGSPFTLNTSFQNPAFKEIAPAFLGMFTAPSWFAAVVITVTPWRGLFWLSPVLLLSLVAMFGWWRKGVFRAERWIIGGVALFFFGINTCFNGFHGGFAAGPRYLIPAIPFLCLPLVPAFVHWRWAAMILGAVSVMQNSLLTATDALNPLGVGDHVWVNRPGEYKDKLYGGYNLVTDYALPLFVQGRAWPIVKRKFEQHLEGVAAKMEKEIPDASVRAARLAEIRRETWAKVERGEPLPLWIAAIPGPVSVNVIGVYEGAYFQLFEAHTPQADWAAFNVGELLFPKNQLSVVPLLGVWFAAWVFSRRWLADERVKR